MEPQVLIPMRLDAFVLNPDVVGAPESRVAPLTQPNFAALSIDPALMQNDVQEHVDLSTAFPAETNSRISYVDTGESRRSRCGVYLHWMLPRMYRGGLSATESAAKSYSKLRSQRGFAQTPIGEQPDTSTPEFRKIPNRWLITRRMNLHSVAPIAAQSVFPEFQSWIVESDKVREGPELDANVDPEVDCVPFLSTASLDGSSGSLAQKAESFLGQKYEVSQWPGDDATTTQNTKRADLHVLAGANALFADYQPFNSNVFSIVDNFSYLDRSGTEQYLQAGTASYSVIGWHSDAVNDPFNNTNGGQVTHKTTIENSFLTTQGVDSWLSTSTSTRALCHGVMYEVEWNIKGRAANPASNAAGLLTTSQPLSVGSSTMDALVAYLKALSAPTDLEIALITIQNLLLKQNDGVDVQLEASDLFYKYNFASSTGGMQWQPTGNVAAGSIDKLRNLKLDSATGNLPPLDELRSVNSMQNKLDLLQREKKQLPWELFAEWWKAASRPPGTIVDDAAAKKIVARLMQLGGDNPPTGVIGTLVSQLPGQVNQLQSTGGLTVNRGSASPFYSPNDPTILLAGVDNPWPVDYTEPLLARLSSQIVQDSSYNTSTSNPVASPAAVVDSDPDWSQFGSFLSTLTSNAKLPADVKNTILSLLLPEFRTLRPLSTGPKPNPPASGTAIAPAFHDTSGQRGLDRWMGTQAFFPLFIEWEGVYFHIPFVDWELGEIPAASTSGATTSVKKLQYMVPMDLSGHISDSRVLSGRTLILPQASLSLQQSVTQLLSQTPPAELKLTQD